MIIPGPVDFTVAIAPEIWSDLSTVGLYTFDGYRTIYTSCGDSREINNPDCKRVPDVKFEEIKARHEKRKSKPSKARRKK